MYAIFLKSVFRVFLRNKLMFILCLFGLSMGYAVFVTIVMHTRYEHSYDNFQPDAKNIYRLHPIFGQTGGFTSQYATSDNGYGPALKQDLPEVKDFVRMMAYQSERIITNENQGTEKIQYREPRVFFCRFKFLFVFQLSAKGWGKKYSFRETKYYCYFGGCRKKIFWQ